MCNRKPSVIVLPDAWKEEEAEVRAMHERAAGVGAHTHRHKKKKGLGVSRELVQKYRYTVPLERMEVYFSSVINPLFIVYIGLHLDMVLWGLEYKWDSADVYHDLVRELSCT